MTGTRIGGITLPDFDAEALLLLVNAAIDELPDTQKPRTEDAYVVHIELNPGLSQCIAVAVWNWPPQPITYP
jgi:hypothetical protein